MPVVDRLKSDAMYRTEVSHRIDMDANKGSSTTDQWFGFSLYIPGPYPVMTNPVYEMLFQLHASPPDGDDWSDYKGINPPLALYIIPNSNDSGDFKLLIRGTNDAYPQQSSQPVFSELIHAYQTNRWYDFVIHTRLDSTSAGFTKVWIDGELAANYSGMTYYRGHGKPYPKIGIYNGWRTRDIPGEKVTARTIYHDEYRYAYGADGGLDVVAPRGGSGCAVELPAPSALRSVAPE